MNMPLIIANVESMGAGTFFVAIVYDDNGDRIDELIVGFTDYDDAIEFLQSQTQLSQKRFEVWTSDRELYVACQRVPGIAAQMKHRTDTSDTGRLIERDKEILTEIYEVEPLPVLSKWRSKVFYYLTKLTLKIGGIRQ